MVNKGFIKWKKNTISEYRRYSQAGKIVPSCPLGKPFTAQDSVYRSCPLPVEVSQMIKVNKSGDGHIALLSFMTYDMKRLLVMWKSEDVVKFAKYNLHKRRSR